MPTKEPQTNLLSAAEKPGSKWCTSCGLQKPCESDFDHDAAKSDGFRDTCKTCRAEQRVIAKMDREDNANSSRMIAFENANLEALDTLSAGGAFNPHSEELAEALMIPFGGVNGFAKNIFATFLCAPPGSSRRVKVLDMIVKLVQANSRMELDERKLELLSDRDLEKMFAEQSQRYSQMTGSRITLIDKMQKAMTGDVPADVPADVPGTITDSDSATEPVTEPEVPDANS